MLAAFSGGKEKIEVREGPVPALPYDVELRKDLYAPFRVRVAQV